MGKKLESKIYRFDRRQFLKTTGVYGVGASFLASGVPAFGQEVPEECKAIENKVELGEDKELNAASALQYFVDGLHFNDRSNLDSRANISIFIEEMQTEERFVERVVLTDMAGNTLGVQYFDADDKMTQGYVPYVIFENVKLVFNQVYNLYYQVRKGEEIELYHAQLANAERSLLNSSSLPAGVLADFEKFRGKNNGLITSAFEHYTGNTSVHSAKGIIQSIGSDNSFRVDIEKMHGDVNNDHYMRYFIVADPVGRILGMVKRAAANNGADPDAGNAPMYGGVGTIAVTAMSDDTAVGLGITANDVAKINDCPYIQIYTEDVFDALARSTIRLR